MKTTTTIVAATSVVLSTSAFADFQGLVERHGDANVSLIGAVGDTIGTVGRGVSNAGRNVLSVPGRVAGVGDGLPPMLSAGTQEFGVSGAVNFADDIIYNLNLSYGWFIQDRWEVGFDLGVSGEDSDINFSLGLFTEYNFQINPTTKWVPFVGFSASWEMLNRDFADADSIALGLDLGLKYFIRENIAISFSLGAKYAFDEVFPGGDDFAQQINIGTKFYF